MNEELSWDTRVCGGYHTLQIRRHEREPCLRFLGKEGNFSNAQLSKEFEKISALLSIQKLFVLTQTHSAAHIEVTPAVITKSTHGVHTLGEADAIVLPPGEYRGCGFAVRAADCLNLIMCAGGWYAVVHAGWRGVAAGIVETTAQLLCARSNTQAVSVWAGPAAGECCYEVGVEVLRAIKIKEVGEQGPGTKAFLNLSRAAQLRLEADGVRAQWNDLGICTICTPEWNSYRRDGDLSGRNMALLSFENFISDKR